DTITDGNGATLTINVTNGNVVVGENNVIGTFTVNGTATATLDNNGVVTYSDGSVQALPARIF
ncbi:MAG: hypothetical protein KDI36_09555, partial [Pseudomonadales bacterium]|nr:hypothetical protein [Pseudomonadales bacterium]